LNKAAKIRKEDKMKSTQAIKVKNLMEDTFREITFCLGGIFLAKNIPDDLVWEITNSVEDIYYNTLEKADSLFPPEGPPKGAAEVSVPVGPEAPVGSTVSPRKGFSPHPAIDMFMEVLDRHTGLKARTE
jgi:hypothetical protein